MQVYCDEGVAIHIGPDPCVAVCEGGRRDFRGPLSQSAAGSMQTCW